MGDEKKKDAESANAGRFIDRLLREHPGIPLFTTLAYVAFMSIVVLIVVFEPNLEQRLPNFADFVSFVLLAGPSVLTILHLTNIKNSLSSIRQLAILYVEIILMFAVIYFYLASVSANRTEIATGGPISGIDAAWTRQLRDENRRNDKARMLLSAARCFQDCLHFSLITSTTVGYGDMAPKGPLAKSIVDIQVLICLFLISFGAGTVFARSNAGRSSSGDSERLAGFEERLKRVEKELEEKRGSHPSRNKPPSDHGSAATGGHDE